MPFAITGGSAALLTHTSFSLSAGIGFIAPFGICIQDGVILITVFKQNILRKMPLAIVVSGGLLTSTVLTPFIFRLIFERTHGKYRRQQQALGAAPGMLLP